MTRDDLLVQLSSPRLPPEMVSLGWREILALVAIGLLVGLLSALLLRPILGRKPSRRGMIRATRGMAPQDRILAIARILGRLPPTLRPAAYGTAPAPDDDAIDRLVLGRRSGG